MSTEPGRQIHSWYTVALLVLCSVLAYTDTQVLNLLVEPIRADLKISDTTMSLLMGPTVAVAFLLASFPLGRLADRHSRRGLIAIAVLGWSLATALCGLARNVSQLLLARIGLAVGKTALGPAAVSLISDSFARDRVATALSVYAIGAFLGIGLAFIFGGVMVRLVAEAGPVDLPLMGLLQPWQAVFLLLGFLGILQAALLLTVREPPRSAQHEAASLAELRGFVRKHRRTLILTNLGFAFMTLAKFASAAWLPAFFSRVHGWPSGDFGVVYGTLVLVFCSAGAIAGGWLADRWRNEGTTDASLRVGLIAALANLPLGALFLAGDDGRLAAAGIVPAAFFAGMPSGVALAALQQLTPSSMRGQITALVMMVITLIALGLGPTSVALCTDYIFRDDRAVGLSIATVCVIAQLLAAACLGAGLKPYRQSLGPSEVA